MTNNELTTTRNRYNDGDRVDVRFVTQWSTKEGWIARSDSESEWYWGVGASVISNEPIEVKQARRAAVEALPGPFAAGDTVVVNGITLTIPEEVKRYGSGYFA